MSLRNLLLGLCLITMFQAVAPAAQANELCEKLKANEDGGKVIHRLGLKNLDEQKIETLETITKQQIIIGFNHLVGARFRSTIDVATSDLIQDGFFWIAVLDGEKYVEVGHFPGDNLYSVFFEYGSLSPVAVNEDGSISCL